MGQNCFECQKFAIEVKTNARLEKNNFNKDIKKLFELISTDNERKYEFGVFICINKSSNNLIKFIKEKLSDDLLRKIKATDKLNKIFCISAIIKDENYYGSNGIDVKSLSLCDILK